MEKQTQLSESYAAKYERYEHSVGVMMLHLEWVTKYRYKMFRKQEYLNIAEACIRRSAFEHKIKIIKLSVMPEHVHCVVQVALSISASKVLQILKGRSSFFSFQQVEGNLLVAEGEFLFADDLIVLVAFARDDNHIAFFR